MIFPAPPNDPQLPFRAGTTALESRISILRRTAKGVNSGCVECLPEQELQHKPETDLRGGWLTVNFFAMANLDNADYQPHIGDRIDDPICSLADAIFILVARKFFTTGRSGIGRKILNALDDAETVFLGG